MDTRPTMCFSGEFVGWKKTTKECHVSVGFIQTTLGISKINERLNGIIS